MSDTTDTPLVDANSFASPYTSVAGEVTAYEMVDANFARELERRLTAALAREKVLREALRKLPMLADYNPSVPHDGMMDSLFKEDLKNLLAEAESALSTPPTP